MILNLFRHDNRWRVRSTRSLPIRGSVVYKPARKQLSIILNGDDCHLRIRQVPGSAIYTLFRAGCILRSAIQAPLRAPLRAPLSAVMHWKSKEEHIFTVKAMANQAKLVLRGRKRTLARLLWHSGGPRIAIGASDQEIGELGLPVILGLFAPLLVTHPIDSSSEAAKPDTEIEEE